jgi:hypothetical protein
MNKKRMKSTARTTLVSLTQFKDEYLLGKKEGPMLSGKEQGRLAAKEALEKIKKDLQKK